MRSERGLKAAPKLVFAFVLVAMMVTVAYAALPPVPAPAALLWSDPILTYDLVVSKNGQYAAVATSNDLRFYGRGSGTPLWSWGTAESIQSVAISADGSCVVVGGFWHVFFWRDASTRTSSTSDPTWSSTSLGPIERRDLDISDDGNYVVAGGTGDHVYYWTNAKSQSGAGIAPATSDYFDGFVEAVDLSSNGDYIAAASGRGEVAYWKNARTNFQPTWTWKVELADESFNDVAISDDGNYIAASSVVTDTTSVHYWAGATSLGGSPSPTWSSGIGTSFYSIDMSSDGGSVVAGAAGTVYFWGGSRGLAGTPSPTWTYAMGPDSVPVRDVAIDDAGDYMAACTFGFLTVYFFDQTGDLEWSWEVGADKLSISGDGATLAVGTPTPQTAFLLSTGFQTPTPVGGFIEPVNQLTVFAPYLALLGIVAAVAVVVVAPWKKPES